MARGTRSKLRFQRAIEADVPEIVALRTDAARDLTSRFGPGHWSGEPTERSLQYAMTISEVWVARHGKRIVATWRIGKRKPWAIDKSYFSDASTPLYLTDMAVHPEVQGQGIGRECMEAVRKRAEELDADAIRLDAYDNEAGAGGFYAACDYRAVGRVVYRGNPLVYFELVLTPP